MNLPTIPELGPVTDREYLIYIGVLQADEQDVMPKTVFEKSGMHAEQIKAAMRMAGTTQAMLADELGLSRSTVTQVVNGNGKSARVMTRISQITGIPISTLWPDSAKPSLVLRRAKASTGAMA